MSSPESSSPRPNNFNFQEKKGMMTRDEIRELASFRADESKGACALSFYFQPDPPQNRSHRQEAIRAKDLVKQALQSDAAKGKNGPLHADLDRILELAT